MDSFHTKVGKKKDEESSVWKFGIGKRRSISQLLEKIQNDS